jgi:hypothetical protein
MKRKTSLFSLFIVALLCAAEPVKACSPASDMPPPNCLKFREAIDQADYIIVTKLEEYLPNDKGRFKVMMTLRGDIPVGTIVKHEAWPLRGVTSCSSGIPLKEIVVFMGKKYVRDGEYVVLKEFVCNGKVLISDSDNTGFDTLHAITNRVLHSKKASWINGGLD